MIIGEDSDRIEVDDDDHHHMQPASVLAHLVAHHQIALTYPAPERPVFVTTREGSTYLKHHMGRPVVLRDNAQPQVNMLGFRTYDLENFPDTVAARHIKELLGDGYQRFVETVPKLEPIAKKTLHLRGEPEQSQDPQAQVPNR